MKKSLLSLLAIIMIATNIHAQIPTNGLVAYYPFNGNANDNSGNGNNGTVNGATLTTDRFGRANSAYSFNGTSNYIVVPDNNSLDIISHFTLSAWINIQDYSVQNNSEAVNSVLGKPRQSGWATGYAINSTYNPDHKSNASFFGNTSTGVSSTGVTPLNQWVHILCTYDSMNLKIYINGKLDSTTKVSFSLANYSTPLYIGTEFIPTSTTWNRYFKGQADDIAIWNRAIDSTEVQSVYHNGGYASTSSIPTNGLIAWYPFTGNTLDSSGNGNHGTNNGATLTTDRFGKANNAYSFNGLSNYISTNSNSIQDFSNQFTISVWLNESNLNANFNQTMVATNAFRFQTGTTPVLTAAWSPVGAVSPYTNNVLVLNSWMHMILIKNGLNIDFYINGKKYDSTFFYPNLKSFGINNLRIGSDGLTLIGMTDYFNGKLDDIRIYNRALDNTELQSLYNEGGYTGILPLHLTTFTAAYQNKQSALRWSSANETNTANFVVERSNNGISFSPIGLVAAKGSGNNSYTFADVVPNKGSNYYRLKMQDKDGSFTYSNVVLVVANTNNPLVTIAPNPAKTTLVVTGNNLTNCTVISTNGTIVLQQPVSNMAQTTIAIGSLPKGVYLLKVVTASGTATKQFVKE